MEESNLFAKPLLDFHDDHKRAKSKLDIKVHVLGESRLEDDHGDQDGLNTPKSAHQRIPLAISCPPAPKKPKSLPSAKRKPSSRQLIYLDLAREFEFMYPPALRADIGNKIKKARQ